MAAPIRRRRVRRVRLGAWDPGLLSGVRELEDSLGRPLDIVHFYQGWGDDAPAFDVERAQAVIDRGAHPMVTWEPWDYRTGLRENRFPLRDIADGRFDGFIRQWGRDLARFGHRVKLRFAHEMNHDVYPWCVGVNGNTAEDYVRAWRRVVRLIRAEGATNVRFVWCPIPPGPTRPPLRAAFPGDGFVDFVGMDGYNAGAAADWGGWLTFSEVFGGLYDQLRRLSDRPVIVAETGCAEQGGSKAAWLQQAFLEELPRRFPAIVAVVWFNESREADWRLESSAETLDTARVVFRSGPFR